jgi:solute carrier family 25 S-adenosylmethionine transporter 26
MEQANPLRIAGVYNGVVGSLVGQVPYGVLTFGSYEMYKRGLLARFAGARPVFLYAIAAILGDLTGSGWLCPSEVRSLSPADRGPFSQTISPVFMQSASS